MKKAILYTRIDSRETSGQKESLAEQEKELREYCEKNNIEVIKVLQEIDTEQDGRKTLTSLLMGMAAPQDEPCLFLFTSIDKIASNLTDLYHNHHNLTKLGLTPKAIRDVQVWVVAITKK